MTGAITAVASWRASLAPFFLPLVNGKAPHSGHTMASVVQAADAIAHLLQVQPILAVTVDPAALAAKTASVRAGVALESALDLLLAEVKDTNRVNLATIWQQSRDVYHVGNRVARSSREVAQAIAPVQVLFQRTPRVAKAAANAGTQTLKATNAANKATKAAQKAAAAHARAAALAPPSLQGPSPSPQGPSPQGPSPQGPGSLPQPTPGPGNYQGPATPEGGSTSPTR